MAKKTFLSGLALLLVSAAATATSTVSGTVTNAATGAALSSMVVAAYDTTLRGSATTDSAGHYLLTLPPGSVRLLAYDPKGVFATAFGGNTDSFDTSPVYGVGSQPVVLNFALQAGGTISGTISAVTGGPIAQATLAAYNLSGTRRGFTQPNASGTYSLLVPPGQYKLVAYDNAGIFAPRFYVNVYGFDPATLVTVAAGALVTGKNVQLEVAGHLSGSIVDHDTGVGLSGTTVYAYAANGVNVAQATADAMGNFILNVAGGAYRLVGADRNQIYATGFLGDTESFDQSSPVSVVASQTVTGVQIPLHRGGMVTGHVTAGGTPLPKITLAAYNDDGSQRTATQTDSFGAYTFVLPGSDFRIAAYDAQLTYATQFYPGKDAFAEASDVAVVPSTTIPLIDFALTQAAKVSGTVTESGTGVPASGVGVAAYDAFNNLAGSMSSDASGAYMLALAAGSYKIVAFDPALRYATGYGGGAPNYQTANVYTVNSNQIETVNLTISRGVKLSGSVTDYQNQPLSGIEIGALDAAGNRVATAIASQGSFTLVLLPGSYEMLASDPTGRYGYIYYSRSSMLVNATTVVVQAGTAPPVVAFVLGSPPRRRAVSH